MNIPNFISYIKYRMKWILAVAFCGIVMAAVMILNHAPNREVGYGAFLCLVVLAVVTGWDFCDYWRRLKILKTLEDSITFSLDGMPECGEPIEGEYRKLLGILLAEKQQLENESIHRQRDLTEYYTMWVHQIKTPIAALKLLLEEEIPERIAGEGKEAEELYREKKRNEELQELFSIEQYVGMALQYMRLGSETTDFVLKQIRLDGVIREAVHKYARQFVRKKLALHYEETAVTVLTDEKWIEFVIEQLLSNALKYTPSGSITIKMEDGKLMIEDTGIGIRGEDLPRVCEKGYTGYNGHADKRSTGIGLYLCSSILKKLGHSFTISSEEGRGTKVVIGFSNE